MSQMLKLGVRYRVEQLFPYFVKWITSNYFDTRVNVPKSDVKFFLFTIVQKVLPRHFMTGLPWTLYHTDDGILTGDTLENIKSSGGEMECNP